MTALAGANGSSPDLGALLRQITETARDLCGCDRAVIALAEPSSAALILHREAAAGSDGGRPSRIEPGAAPGDQVLATGRPFRRTYGAEDLRLPEGDPEPAGGAGVMAELVVPIRSEQRILGLLYAENRSPRPFTDRDEASLLRLADLVAAALANADVVAAPVSHQDARPAGDAEARRREQEVLQELDLTIDTSLDLDRVLQSVAEAARELCASDMSMIALREAGSGAMVVRYRVSPDPAAYIGRRIEAGKGVGGHVLLTGRPFRSEDTVADPRITKEYQQWDPRQASAASIAVPIWTDGRMEGLLYAQHRSPRRWSDRDEAILVRLADHATAAIWKARLYRDVHAHAERMKVLADLGRTLAETLDPDVLVGRIAASVRGILGAGQSIVYGVDQESGALVGLVASGFEGLGPRPVFPPGTGVVGLAVRERRVVTTSNLLTDPRVELPAEMRARIERAPYRAVLAVPLLVRDRVIGALAVGDREDREFDEEAIRLTQAFADQAALALENSQLYAEAARRRREAEELARTARTLTESLDVTAVARRINEAVMSLLAPQSSAVQLLQPDGSLVVVAASQSEETLPPGEISPAGQGVGVWAIIARRVVTTPDALEEPGLVLAEYERRLLAASGLRAFMGAPLRTNTGVIGAVTIGATPGRVFTGSEAALIQALADQASLALQNARLHGAALVGMREMAALVDINRAVTSAPDYREVARAVLDAARQVLPGCASQVWEAVPGEQELRRIACLGFGDHGAGPRPNDRIGEGLNGRCAATGERLTSADMRTDPRVASRDWIVAEGLVSALILPLIHGGMVYGTLDLFTRESHEFTADEIGLLESLAAQTAATIANARLYGRAEERARRLTTLAELSRAIASAPGTQDVFDAVAAAASQLLGGRLVRVLSADPVARVLRAAATFALARAGPEPLAIIRYGQGIAGHVILSRTPDYVADIQRDPRWASPALASAAGLHACATLPLMVADRAVGILQIAFGERPEFSPEEKELMRLLADHAAIAIQNKGAEEGLRRAHAETEQLLTSISWILIAVDSDGVVTRWNHAADQAFGIPAAEAVGRPLADSGARVDWTELLGRIESLRVDDRPRRLEDIPFTRPDGKQGFLSFMMTSLKRETPSSAGFLLLGSDVTERRILEMQLAQAQRLESIGQLAAGIAHEINTPIQFVGDNARFLQSAFEDLRELLDAYEALRDAAEAGSSSAELVERVRRAQEKADFDYLVEEIPRATAQTLDGVGRVASIVRALKEFAHPDQKEKVPTDLNRALQSTLTVARNEIKYVADVETDLGDLPSVVCHPGDLNQVFLNLIVNAAQAIADVVAKAGGRGRIGVRTTRQGDEVVVAISDTGGGIPEPIRARIFDPFFTTKPVGHGTGQGLAIARTVVVDRHGGSLTFETEVGRGTTFFVRLPVHETAAPEDAAG
jgi:PAS domain S-box-containing protein